MRVVEAIKAKMRAYPVQHTSIEVTCIDNGVDPNADYSLDLKRECNLVVIDLLKQLLALSSISQSDVSLGFDTEMARKRLLSLLIEEGLDTTGYTQSSVIRVW